MNWRDEIEQDYEEVRSRFKGMTFAAFQRGDWFGSFVAWILARYVQQVDLDAVCNRYRGTTPEEQALHAIEVISKRCSVAGSLTSSLATAAEVSLIPTFGLSFPGVGAAVGLAVMSDIGYCIRTQVRGIYDLSVLYGGPLLEDDVEDCYLIFLHAMQVNLADVAGPLKRVLARTERDTITYNARSIIQTGLRRFFAEVTARGGGGHFVRKLLARVNMRMMVPGVSIALGGNFNRRFTRHVLRIAERQMRWRGAVLQPLIGIYDYEPYLEPRWIIGGIIVVVEAGSPADWSRHQIDALRYCQSMLGMSDDDLALLDEWFLCKPSDFAALLPPMRSEVARTYLEVLIVAAAMQRDSRCDPHYARAIATLSQATGMNYAPLDVAQVVVDTRRRYRGA